MLLLEILVVGVAYSLYHAVSLQVYTPVCPVSFTCSGSENVPSRLFVVQLPRT
jgi:hypothetical protein